MKCLLLSVVLAFTSTLPAQNPQPDSLPLPGKTKPAVVGMPPVSPAPQVDTFYPSKSDTAQIRTDPHQRDDRDPGTKRGLYQDTIPK